MLSWLSGLVNRVLGVIKETKAEFNADWKARAILAFACLFFVACMLAWQVALAGSSLDRDGVLVLHAILRVSLVIGAAVAVGACLFGLLHMVSLHPMASHVVSTLGLLLLMVLFFAASGCCPEAAHKSVTLNLNLAGLALGGTLLGTCFVLSGPPRTGRKMGTGICLALIAAAVIGLMAGCPRSIKYGPTTEAAARIASLPCDPPPDGADIWIVDCKQVSHPLSREPWLLCAYASEEKECPSGAMIYVIGSRASCFGGWSPVRMGCMREKKPGDSKEAQPDTSETL